MGGNIVWLPVPMFDEDELRGPAPHPAQYSEELWPGVIELLKRPLPGASALGRLLDPFGGVGGIFTLQPFFPATQIDAVEIEPDWACANRKITVGSALHLPWGDNTFDGAVTSPTYGNRMADDFNCGQGGAGRNTYRHKLGHALHPENSGGLQWGPKYRTFHQAAWHELQRVLRSGARFVLNCKDHIRAGQRQRVTAWHVWCLNCLGFEKVQTLRIETPGQRYGANSDLRLEFEYLILLQLRKEG